MVDEKSLFLLVSFGTSSCRFWLFRKCAGKTCAKIDYVAALGEGVKSDFGTREIGSRRGTNDTFNLVPGTVEAGGLGRFE